MKNLIYLSFLGLTLLLACNSNEAEIITPEPPPVELKISPEIMTKWAEMTLHVIEDSPSNSPTYASRSLGYMGIGAYESTVQGSIIYQSVAPSLNGLVGIPRAIDSLSYNWEISLNKAQADILKYLYPHASSLTIEAIDSLQIAIENSFTDSSSIENKARSITFGEDVANAVINWATTDGGHLGYANTFDRSYPLPRGEGLWVPPLQGQSSIRAPMTPEWGNNRNFTTLNANLGLPDFLTYSTDTESEYFKQMQELYLIQNNLTQEQKENAIWWGDDPSDSVSPPGHSYYLANVLVKQEQPNLFEATSVFAKVGMSLADAFINCWKCKFHFNSERPTPYIRSNITRSFTQFWPEPPFPAFTSGHSTQAAAAAVAMASVFGDTITFTDDLHANRPKDFLRDVEFKSRTFNTLWSMAEECGYSRLEGGIHIKADNEVGLEEGRKIAENVNSMPWKVSTEIQ